MNGLYIAKDKISHMNMLDEYNKEYSIYPDFVPFATPDNYEKLLDELKLKAEGINNDGIKEIFYWAIKDGKIVGSASIRLNPHDNPDVLKYNGHIMYGVVPSLRGKGYGSYICHLLIVEARKLGLNELIVCCNDDNESSKTVIKNNYGKFIENVEPDMEFVDKKTSRYIINVQESISNYYKNVYKEFLDTYEKLHVSPWHNISRKQIELLAEKFLENYVVDDDFSFTYFINFIIKNLSGERDAHTYLEKFYITNNVFKNHFPIYTRVFDDGIYLFYPSAYKNCKLISINGVSIDKIVSELDNVITYGTEGRKKYMIEDALHDKYMLGGLPSLRNAKYFSFTIENSDKSQNTLTYSIDYVLSDEDYNELGNFIYPPIYYEIIDNSVCVKIGTCNNRYTKKIINMLNNLSELDLDNISTIIIDLRGNTGGNSAALSDSLYNFLDRNNDKKLVCLTDYRVFSAARHLLSKLIKKGAVTVGDEISTPISCFGECKQVFISKYNFSISSKFFNPFKGYASDRDHFNETISDDVYDLLFYKPDVLIKSTSEDFINNIDPVLEYALSLGKEKKKI